MTLVYVAIPFLLLGGTMFVRGWVYTLRPEGKMAEKRKRRNLKIGFPTDMKYFGRRVRRLGFVLLLIGGGLIGWHLSAPTADGATPEDDPASAVGSE